MQKYIFSLILLLSVVGLIAENFEFLGIKSGMTKDEVKMIIEYDKLSLEESFAAGCFDNPKKIFDEDLSLDFREKVYSDTNYSNIFTKYPTFQIYFYFTSDDVLWKINLYFNGTSMLDNSYKINTIAQLQALQASFPKAEIEQIDVNTYGGKNFAVSLIDIKIFEDAVNKMKNEYIGKYTTK